MTLLQTSTPRTTGGPEHEVVEFKEAESAAVVDPQAVEVYARTIDPAVVSSIVELSNLGVQEGPCELFYPPRPSTGDCVQLAVKLHALKERYGHLPDRAFFNPLLGPFSVIPTAVPDPVFKHMMRVLEPHIEFGTVLGGPFRYAMGFRRVIGLRGFKAYRHPRALEELDLIYIDIKAAQEHKLNLLFDGLVAG